MSEYVSIVLAAGSVLGPIFYGFLIYKMSDNFVTQKEYAKDNQRTEEQRAEVKDALHEIQVDMKIILKNSAFADD